MSTTINKVTTKFGDSGLANLVKKNVRKSSTIIDLIGSLDESNASIGTAVTMIRELSDFKTIIDQVHNHLFDLGVDVIYNSTKVTQAHITFLENQIEDLNSTLPPLESFVLPNDRTAPLHLARTVVRRAERAFWAYYDERGDDSIFTIPGIYLNRLSDFLFILCRVLHNRYKIKEELWERAK